jgi:carboxymethylenebutenolidase
VAGKTVEIQVNGRSIQAYFSAPEKPTARILVLQEWWGLVDHVKDLVDRFADAGFAALAPDLYEGKTATSPDEAGKLMMALNIDKTESDLAAAGAYLAKNAAGVGDKLGVVGFCMGGQLALYAASKNPNIGAAVNFYGIHPDVHPAYEAIEARVLGFFGSKDPMVTPEVVTTLRGKLEAAAVSFDFTTFDDADHAFFNDTRADVYDSKAAQEAWQHMLGFFRAALTE